MPSDAKTPTPTSEDATDVFASILEELEGRSTPQRWHDLMKEVSRAATLRAALGHGELVKIGRFEGIATRGVGGYGVVFEVRDPELDRHVALKLCLTSGPKAAQALLDEARLLAKLTHPNIVTIHEPGRFGEDVFFVMELVRGHNGQEFARRDPPPTWEEAVDVYRHAGRGLAAAHDAGIVHGDFKPLNVLLDESGWPRVSDFGLAQVMREHQGEADEGDSPRARIGTLAYMAPEVLRGEPADALADQWSFCVSLWQTLEGRLPFDGRTLDDMIASTMLAEPATDAREAPERVRAVVRRGLSPDPSERYRDIGELLAELDKLREPPVPTLEPTPEGSGPGSSGGRGARAFMIAMLVVGGGILGALLSAGAPWSKQAGLGSLPMPERLVPDSIPMMETELCAGADAPLPIGPEVRGVCRLIRDGAYKEAGVVWEGLLEGRSPTTPAEWLKSASDSAVVALTFADQARRILPENSSLALELATKAEHWATWSLTGLDLSHDLGGDEASPLPEIELLVSDVYVLTSPITGSDYPKHSTVPSSFNTP